MCGKPGVPVCDDPSQSITWDGVHFTEAAYRLIADGLIKGPYSDILSLNLVTFVS